jgi:hypothetical protein
MQSGEVLLSKPGEVLPASSVFLAHIVDTIQVVDFSQIISKPLCACWVA